jgi:hypothetical protein
VSRQRPRTMLSVMYDSTTVAAVAPDTTFAYGDSDWQKIKASLAGVDADAVKVGDRWWAQPCPRTALTRKPKRLLREQLQEMAADYLGLWSWRANAWSLTLKQELARTQEASDVLKRAQDVLVKVPRVGAVSRAAGDLPGQLGALIDKIDRHCDMLEDAVRGKPHFRLEAAATGGSGGSSDNARKAHTEYWDKLVLMWQTITHRKQQRGLTKFLHACSKPAFKDQTTENGVRSFLARMRQTNFQKARRLTH